MSTPRGMPRFQQLHPTPNAAAWGPEAVHITQAARMADTGDERVSGIVFLLWKHLADGGAPETAERIFSRKCLDYPFPDAL